MKAIALGANAVGVGRLNGFGDRGGRRGRRRPHAGAAGRARSAPASVCSGVNRLGELDARYLHRAEPVHGGGMRSVYPLLEEDPWAAE